MTRDERKMIAEDIINLIEKSLKRCQPLIDQFNTGTRVQKKKIIRDVLNHYIDIKYVPEKAEGLAIEKAVGIVMDYVHPKRGK